MNIKATAEPSQAQQHHTGQSFSSSSLLHCAASMGFSGFSSSWTALRGCLGNARGFASSLRLERGLGWEVSTGQEHQEEMGLDSTS